MPRIRSFKSLSPARVYARRNSMRVYSNPASLGDQRRGRVIVRRP